MTQPSMIRFAAVCGTAFAALMLTAPAIHAQVAPIPYMNAGAPFGSADGSDTQYWGSPPDEDSFRKGFSFRSFSTPVSAFGSGLAWSGASASGFNFSGLTADGAQYGYSFKTLGDTPMTLFGGVTTLRSNPDVFTSLVTPGFASSNALATSIQAGVEFKPTSNVSLSFSAGVVQPSAPIDTDLRSQLISGYRR